ncbi:uncharacterized protein BDZ99DRAFT_164356 [Mytilinidion resinicola]|uniref:EF-hand domain-containing protein n=1 Tax=Mytilinidion resinicola TaxID=574789 RepID=A0A6A6Y5C6_9PEZI|nr:uncharacterized protein BDZ99DRAFT_164356 [Mytilinidion resinicola]KAF2803860.1 hypothetical protein BDZ99DRAFT_164356 [Mytilinidion resinicola]
MSTSPNQHRFSRQGFQPLDHQSSSANNASIATMENIPLETVVSHTPSHARTVQDDSMTEKSGMFHRSPHGRRRLKTLDSKTGAGTRPGAAEEDTALNRMGRIYEMILNFSIVTRYFIYVLPLALCLAVPLIVGATVAEKSTIGKVRIVWIFTWLEIVWLSLWISKIVAHFLPNIFEFVAGVVSAGVRKYALILKSLEIPLSIVGWAMVSLATFIPVTYSVPTAHGEHKGNVEHWQTIVRQVLVACLISACILLGERLLIQLISINYHRKQFDSKIKDSKHNIYLLSLLYDASVALFPAYGNDFAEEDYIIQDSLQLSLGSKKGTHARSGSATPMRLLQDVGRFGDKVTSAFGHIAHEVTGKKVFNPNSAHSIVIEALEKKRSSEALAKRLWMSFVVEGKNELYQDDIVEVLGNGRQTEAEEAFSALDRDGNGDISLDEMILTVTEFGRERKSIATSMHDVDQAINVLDGLLSAVVFLICIFVFIAFLNASFVTTLATSATALLSLSFVFAATCQEVLGSCIFLFVKHPFDIGDRIDIGLDQFTVEHISLLFTVFKRVATGKMVQIPNIVLNSVWIENVSRSKAMREQVAMFVNFDTTFEDIKLLKNELQSFVTDRDNSRDFQPEIEVEVVGIAEMNKLELRVEIRHKSNWANEVVRSARRSKFMCALVLAFRKVPIYGPGGGDAGLGEYGKPSWSVAISPEEAIHAREKYNEDKDAKRLFPAKKPESPDSQDKGKSSGTDYLAAAGAPTENKAAGNLNARNPGATDARDDAWEARDDVSTLGRPSTEHPDFEEIRGLLRKESSRGKRKQGPVVQQPRQGMPPIPIPITPQQSQLPSPPVGRYDYAPAPGRSPPSVAEEGYQNEVAGTSRRPVPPPQGNAFAVSMQRPVQAPRLTGVASNNPYQQPPGGQQYRP